MSSVASAIGAMLLLALLSVPAEAAITFDSASSSTAGNIAVTTVTWSHTVGAGVDRILVVGVSLHSLTTSVSSVTYAGSSLTLIGSFSRVSMWRLLAPPVGTANIVATLSPASRLVVGATSYFGVDQTTPTGAFVSGSGPDTVPPSITVTSAVGELVVDTLVVPGPAGLPVVGAGQTQRWNDTTGSTSGHVGGAGSSEPGAASVTMSWTLPAARGWVMGAVSLKPASTSIVVMKTASTTSDPFNGATNPKAIPGAEKLYSILVTNTGSGSATADSIVVTDPIPTNTELFVGDLGGVGSGPVLFIDGAPISGLTYTFTSLGSTTDDLEFSNNGGATWTYTPVPDVNGYDSSVTNIRVNPKGTFNGATGAGNPSFTLRFRVRIR